MQDEMNETVSRPNNRLKKMHLTTALPVDEADLCQLHQLASTEARLNRDELEKLYNDSYTMTGELRYHLLWRLSQLERKCCSLERAIHEVPNDLVELEQVRKQVSELTLQAVQLRQEARLLINAWRRAETTGHRERPGSSGTSGRRYPSYAGV